MAGGTGGTGGSPRGASGYTGTTQPQGTYGPATGGAGGDNGATLSNGGQVFGPFGQGGTGADIYSPIGGDGAAGAVVIVWGPITNG